MAVDLVSISDCALFTWLTTPQLIRRARHHLCRSYRTTDYSGRYRQLHQLVIGRGDQVPLASKAIQRISEPPSLISGIWLNV